MNERLAVEERFDRIPIRGRRKLKERKTGDGRDTFRGRQGSNVQEMEERNDEAVMAVLSKDDRGIRPMDLLTAQLIRKRKVGG